MTNYPELSKWSIVEAARSFLFTLFLLSFSYWSIVLVLELFYLLLLFFPLISKFLPKSFGLTLLYW
jgi:uncharacterized membrane protein